MNSKIVHIMFFHIITIVKCFRLSTVFGTATNYYGNYKITVFNVSILKWYPSNILQPTELSMFFFFFKLLVISFFNLMQFIVKKKKQKQSMMFVYGLHEWISISCFYPINFTTVRTSTYESDKPSQRELTLSINTHTKRSLTVCLLSSVLIICRMCIVYSNSM